MIPSPIISAPLRLASVMQARQQAREKAEAWHDLFRTRPCWDGKIEAAVAATMGVSCRTARRMRSQWEEGGRDAAALIDRRLSPDRNGTPLNPEFLEHWRSRCEQNGRKCAPAYRALVRDWRAGVPIPGTPAGASRRGPLPRGWSLANLMRHAPSTFELTAARVGRQAGAPYRPLVFTTRRGMEVGQQIMFDDLWHDFQVVVLGQRRPSRLLQLHAHDVFSGCQFARGIKPRLEDPESGRSVQLDAGDMLFLLAHVLGSVGYNPTGTQLLLENGTATVTDDLAALLSDLTGGIVQTAFADIQGAASFSGQYAGRGKGNYRFKAHLESSHNLIHNETAGLLDLPGQTGSNSRINAPEQLHGQQQSLDIIQRAMLALPAHVAADLRLPFVEASKAIWALEEIQERINRRTDHDLEGWVEAGLTAMEFDLPGGVHLTAEAYSRMPEVARQALATVAVPTPRKMSPREVFDLGKPKLVRLRPEAVARLLVGTSGREVRVGKNHLITVEDASISPSPLRYLAHTFPEGDTYRAVINPFAPEQAHLFDAANRWLGTVRIWQAVSRIDEAGLAEQMAEAAQIQAQMLQPLARRGAEITRRRLADTQHNTSAIAKHLGAQDDLSAAADAAILNIR